MQFWLYFWTVVLIVAVGLFAGLAVAVSIGGLFDIGAMFRHMARQHDTDTPEQEPNSPGAN